MYRNLKSLSLMGLTLTTPLFAHSGEHHEFSASHFTGHLVTILAMVIVPVSLAYLGYRVTRKTKTQK